MPDVKPLRIKTISEFLKLRHLPKPAHPLLSVIDLSQVKNAGAGVPQSLMLDFYAISLKHNFQAKFKYGQQQCDFDEGVMFFIAPKQVFSISLADNQKIDQTGWMLLIHPDFLWNTALAQKIGSYKFFDYAVYESLFLSEAEENILNGIVKNIERESLSAIDTFSPDIIIAQIETLLSYAERFYHRQFLTRRKSGGELLVKLEDLLNRYFAEQNDSAAGLPTVKYLAERLNMSPSYLSQMLRALTGQSAQQHLHDKLIEKAKEQLTTTSLSVGEIAYRLGFEHPQSFNKLFKNKTKLSPREFRNLFN